MKRFTFLIVLLAFLVGVSAFGYTPKNVSPTGALDWMVYDLTDAFGDVMNKMSRSLFLNVCQGVFSCC